MTSAVVDFRMLKNLHSVVKIEQAQNETLNAMQKEAAVEAKTKQPKEADKSTKNKENNLTKNKSNKKGKHEQRKQSFETKKEAESTPDKRSQKINTKDLEKEKKEWVNEGLAIVKTEKTTKGNETKAEVIKTAEEAERKKKEQEKLSAEEEKKEKQTDLYKKQQVEPRKQVMATAASQLFEELQSTAQSTMNLPWGSSQNGGGGLWDSPSRAVKTAQPEAIKHTLDAARSKKKPVPKEITPAAEFDTWCTTVLTSWSAKIDVPTFVGFLKDIESPYEVKDYVKCYLGDSQDSNDFARHFLERRSKLLCVGTVMPSHNLCSPAMEIHLRTRSKGKKTKKNKMMKVNAARLLGFSVTAAEDRINVGEIDTV